MKNALLVFCLVLLVSCNHRYTSSTKTIVPERLPAAPDYSDLRNWAAHPWKHDPSDSIPAPLKPEMRDSSADIFFLHPTTYTGKRSGSNGDLQDSLLNAKTDGSTILYQASAFNQHARVFAPRYRQAHISAFYIKDTFAFEVAYGDLRRAFIYYLEHYNKGRPIVIASHSQGAFLGLRLLKEFFDGKPLQKQLVAAYIIGWPTAQNEFSHIRACSDSTATGCVISWRTFKRGYVPEYVYKEPAALVTNPLNWRTDTSYAASSANRGSVLLRFNKVILHATDARAHGNVLWARRPRFPGSIFYRTRNYHIADINLFYINIRENLELRIHNFLQKP